MAGTGLDFSMWIYVAMTWLTAPVLVVVIWVCARYRGLSRHMYVLVLGLVGLLASFLWSPLSSFVMLYRTALGIEMSPQVWGLLRFLVESAIEFLSWCLIAVGLHLVFADIRRLLTVTLERGRTAQDRESA